MNMDVNEQKNTKQQLQKLRKLLKKGVVEFSYKKKDGTTRKAKGTLKNSLIPETDQNDDRKTKTSGDCFYYYDLKRDDWRCFLKDNFIKIKESD